MGFFDFLFGKTIRIEHDFFGRISFNFNKDNPDKSWFNGRCSFMPAEKNIQVFIDADVAGPTQLQVDFYKSIENNFTEISQSIISALEDEFRNWKEDFVIRNLLKEFELMFIQLPRCETQPVVWEIAFDTEYDRNHLFTVTMNGFIAKFVSIDG
jgi:hypothetical protein